MTSSLLTERCLTFINSQLQPASAAAEGASPARKLAVTLSRQTGSGAWQVAERLAEYLEERAPAENRRWTVFDRELVEKVLEDHNLPKKLAQYMPEDRVSAIEDMMHEVLGLAPASWTLVHQTMETVLKLAELGQVILIGRGANLITSRLGHMFHVRLVGSLEKRVARVREYYKFDQRAAAEFILKTDRGRQRYLKEHFKVEGENPLLYDLVINTDRITCADAAVLIGDAMLRRAPVREWLA
jgi:cytidylate kinase